MTTDSTKTTKRFSWKSALFLCFCTGVLAVGLSIFIQTRSSTVEAFSAGDLTPKTTAAPAALGAGSSFEAPGQPSRLIIPAIGLNANIQTVGLWWRVPTDIGIPTNFTDVAWYNGSPLPGAPGSSVIDGHLDGANVKEAVFYNLDKLQPGDRVEVVDTNGKTLQFTVVATKLYAYNASTTEIFASDDSAARLNLITCAGDWIKSQGLYNQRVVVFTELATSTAQ